MFARVKQEFLQKRLRQQQIEQMLGFKSRLPALPSTAADAEAEAPGPSRALALQASPESTAEPSEASPGQSSSQSRMLPFWSSTLEGLLIKYQVYPSLHAFD